MLLPVTEGDPVTVEAPPRPVYEFLARDPNQTAPCERCGAPVHPMAAPRDHPAPPFAICLLSEAEACLRRVRDRAAAAHDGQDGAPVQAPVRRVRPRPSQARKTLLGQPRSRLKRGTGAT